MSRPSLTESSNAPRLPVERTIIWSLWFYALKHSTNRVFLSFKVLRNRDQDSLRTSTQCNLLTKFSVTLKNLLNWMICLWTQRADLSYTLGINLYVNTMLGLRFKRPNRNNKFLTWKRVIGLTGATLSSGLLVTRLSTVSIYVSN